jgi:hypothetical protein
MEGGSVVAEKMDNVVCLSLLELWDCGTRGFLLPTFLYFLRIDCLIVFFAAIGCRLSVV